MYSKFLENNESGSARLSKVGFAVRAGGSFLVGAFVAFALFSSPSQEVSTGDDASSLAAGMTCPRQAKLPSVPVMQATLEKKGIAASSQMARAALTAYAASRDVSMAAQAKEEFAKLDPATKAKLTKLKQEVVVRAAKATQEEELAGVTAPLGFFDPWGFSNEGDVAAYRRAELKHGRVCMVAALGIIVSEKFHPLFDKWGDSEPFVSAVQTHFTETAGKNFWPAFWFMAFGHEFVTSNAEYEGKDSFDYGFDPLKLRPDDPVKFRELQNKELNNGRLAMVSAAGMIAQELVTGKAIF